MVFFQSEEIFSQNDFCQFKPYSVNFESSSPHLNTILKNDEMLTHMKMSAIEMDSINEASDVVKNMDSARPENQALPEKK